jgi:hypothetical protein
MEKQHTRRAVQACTLHTAYADSQTAVTGKNVPAKLGGMAGRAGLFWLTKTLLIVLGFCYHLVAAGGL